VPGRDSDISASSSWPIVPPAAVGTQETMRHQCARLLEVAAIPSVALHVLPSSLGANPGLGGAIALAATDDARRGTAPYAWLASDAALVPAALAWNFRTTWKEGTKYACFVSA
jgi:Domain of unknown function (DUF5753)